MASAGGVANTLIYAERWAEKLQEMLDEPTRFKEICEVEYTNDRVVHNPYLTDPVVQNLARGSSYTFSPVTETDESITINTKKIVPVFIDRADLAQSTFLNQMRIAERQGILLNESVETDVYANHANMTNFGSGDITAGTVGDTVTITVSETNIDNIVRHLVRVVRVANGEGLLNRYGGFIVWRPADFELLTGFMMANGYNLADITLKKGLGQGVEFGGLYHYTSNFLAANHVIAGVKRAFSVYILKDTYGQIMVNDKDPNEQSGVSVVSRVDYLPKVWNNLKPIIFDVNVT